MTSRFVQQLRRFILQHTMIENGETVLVAVSGGTDSIALLYGLHALRVQLNCHLHVAHLNHGLRPDAETDAEFVRQQAARLELPFTGNTVELPRLIKQWNLSVEAAGRKARYQFYEDVAKEIGATKVALGHHKDDTAETVLMNLLRGAGTPGLKGIPPVRAALCDMGNSQATPFIIRPLAGFTRQEIEAFLTSMSLTPRHDSTNTDKRYLRNRIRHELMPLLERNYNPNIKTGLSRTAEVLGAETEYLDTIAREAFEACRLGQRRRESEARNSHPTVPVNRETEAGAFSLAAPVNLVLDRVVFLQYHLALQRRILRHSISDMLGQVSDFYFQHCEAILNLIIGDAPNAVLVLPNGLQFRRAYQQLIFERKPGETGDFAQPLVVPGKTFISALNAEITTRLGDILPSDGIHLPDSRFEAVFDYEAIHLPLTVRNRQQGDRFQPYGMRGTKKIKDFLIDAKVPRCERDHIPMLVHGDEILWLIGYTTSERFKIQPQTRKYLHLYYASNETSSAIRFNS